MARRNNRRSGVKPFYTFALSWLFLSAFLPMFRLSTLILSAGLCGVLSYFLGRSRGRQEKKAEEAARKAQVEAAQVKPQYTSQRVQQQAKPQYTSQRVQNAQPEKKSYGPEIDPIVEEGNRALSEMGRLYMSIKDPAIRVKINELMRVTDKITQDAIADPSLPGRADAKLFSDYLVTAGIPDPDLIIRTSGEMRISNYLLWQAAYSEYYFTDTLWPDFRKEEFLKALDEYSRRDRRYGKVK